MNEIMGMFVIVLLTCSIFNTVSVSEEEEIIEDRVLRELTRLVFDLPMLLTKSLQKGKDNRTLV